MGVVYLARDEALLRRTAVKILSWSMPEQHGLDPEAWFLAEARHVARINHPHVVSIYGVAKHRQHCYIAMEYVAGAAADAWVATHGPFSPVRATEILLQAASALQAAHDAGVVHRDVKPGNLLITPEGTAKLGDFGMAMSVHATNPEVTRAGTPFYTGPEIWRGEPASAATDIYALGATYFYLLTGRPPFEARDLDGLIAAHGAAAVPNPSQFVPNLTDGCAELIQRCMAKAAKDRYLSAQDLSWEVRGLVRDLNSVAPPPASDHRSDGQREHGSATLRESRKPASFGSSARSVAATAPRPALGLGEPFASTRKTLQAAVEDVASHSVLFGGERGSGKTTLVQQLMADYERSAPVLSLWNDEPGRPLSQQISRTFGVVPLRSAKANDEIDGLLEELERAHPGQRGPALLVLDNLSHSPARLAELSTLMQAAVKTRAFRILVIATPELDENWSRTGIRDQDVGLRRIVMPALTAQQTLAYMASWLDAALSSSPRRFIVTPDATLLIAHRSGGNLARINSIAGAMLETACSEGRSVLSSWDAWVTSADSLAPLRLPVLPRPTNWPSPDVLEILNAQRRAAGIAARRAGTETKRRFPSKVP
jgi:serine/threonine protein kinase